MNTNLRHGGDLSVAVSAFGVPDDGWLDLSTGINPVPYPVPELPLGIWQRLPLKADTHRLVDAARRFYNIPDSAALVPAPGTQAIIQWLPALRERCHVQVIGPTYEEHAARWQANGHHIEIIEDIANVDADILVIVNPNNPDGRTVAPDVLLALAETQAARGGLLIVDEAFADVMPEISVAMDTGRPGLVVLRSFGKFFGLAGMRLGFAAGCESDIAPLVDALGPWCVAGPALVIGADALGNRDWHEKTRTRLIADAARLDDVLLAAGLDIVGGTTLFRLAQFADTRALYEKLGHAGILVRMFDAHPEWLRFGLPGTEYGWQRLEQALAVQNP